MNDYNLFKYLNDIATPCHEEKTSTIVALKFSSTIENKDNLATLDQGFKQFHKQFESHISHYTEEVRI